MLDLISGRRVATVESAEGVNEWQGIMRGRLISYRIERLDREETVARRSKTLGSRFVASPTSE